MSRWYRAYEGTVTDAKLGEVALVAGCSRSVAIAVWHCILESCATANDRGRFDLTPRRCAVILQEPVNVIEAAFAEMQSLGMIEGDTVCSWQKRQFESDSSTERSRKHREAKRNGDATLQQRDATPPYTETDTDTERNIKKARGTRLRDDLEPEGFEAFWSAYPKRDGNADRKGAVKAFGPAVRRAGGHEAITRAAARYAAHCRDKGKLGTEFVKQARSWLTGDLWREWLPSEPSRPVLPRVAIREGTPAWDAWKRTGRRFNAMDLKDENGHVIGRGWYFESEFPPQEQAA